MLSIETSTIGDPGLEEREGGICAKHDCAVSGFPKNYSGSS